MARIDDGEHDLLREFCARNHVTHTQFLNALMRRLHLSKIDVAEAVEEARDRDVHSRDR